MGLNIQSNFDQEKKTWNVSVNGEIDVSSASNLRCELDQVYRDKEGDIVLHLDGLHYIDSTGLGVIISAFGRMKEAGHNISVVNPTDNVRKLLHITCLDRILCSVR